MKKEIVDNLFNLKRNEIVLNIEKKSEFDLTGTHFGGLPAVPKGFKWPVYRDIEIGESYYINFLAQFNCEDLVQYDIEGILPQKGLLSFFYDIEGQPWTGISDRQGCLRVFLFENIENLICAEKPDDFEEEILFPNLSIGMENRVSYPGWEDYDLVKKDMSREERCMYCDVLEMISENETENVSKLLGWADVIQGTMLRECDEMIYGERRIDADIIDEWQLLLQVNTIEHEDFELMFGDCGTIYFYIRKDDLVNRKFDNVCLMLQCG